MRVTPGFDGKDAEAAHGGPVPRSVVFGGMGTRSYSGLILDFAGVLTSNMVDVIRLFEARERMAPGTFLHAWADPAGQELFRRLETGEINQRQWNEGFGALMNVSPDGLMARYLYELDPAYDVLRVARQAREAGVKTAVLSNSLGRDPYDPYAPYDLRGVFDVVVFSSDHGIRKPDKAIFRLTCDQLDVPPEYCVFADDSETNLGPAAEMGMTVIHALDEQETAATLRSLLRLGA